MSKRLFINGAGGRIGRGITYEVVQSMNDIEFTHKDGVYLIGMNEPRGIDFVVNNFNSRDPVHGLYDWKVKKIDDKTLSINGMPVSFYAEKDISKIPFKETGIEMVL